jgi:uncharacterized protein (DUF488 family)
MRIWSVGHGARSLDEFFTVVAEASIDVIADIRSFPGSRRHPHFGAKALAASLAERGITYDHLRGLGGRRAPRADSPHGALRVAAFRGYAEHMTSEEFHRDYERLREIATHRRTAFMCAETLWWRCHRRMLADRLAVDGWDVTHLLDVGKSAPHALWDVARIVDGALVYDGGRRALNAEAGR